jgi:hypothetical protein
MLGNFEDKSVLDSFNFECIENGRNLSFELHIHDGTNDLHEVRHTCEICPFLSEATLPVEKSREAPLIRFFINISIIND